MKRWYSKYVDSKRLTVEMCRFLDRYDESTFHSQVETEFPERVYGSTPFTILQAVAAMMQRHGEVTE